MTSLGDQQHPHYRADVNIGPMTPRSEFIEEDDADSITQACPRCGVRIESVPAESIHPDDVPDYRDDELVWFEAETLSFTHHDDVRCYRQRKVRDANSDDLATWLIAVGDKVRMRWHDAEDSPQRRAVILGVKAEQAIVREYRYATLLSKYDSELHPERPVGFTEGVRWSMHMLAQAHRGEDGWRREWDADYLAQLDNEQGDG